MEAPLKRIKNWKIIITRIIKCNYYRSTTIAIHTPPPQTPTLLLYNPIKYYNYSSLNYVGGAIAVIKLHPTM